MASSSTSEFNSFPLTKPCGCMCTSFCPALQLQFLDGLWEVKSSVNEYLRALAFLLVLEPHISYCWGLLNLQEESKEKRLVEKMCSFFVGSEMKNTRVGGRTIRLALVDPAWGGEGLTM